MILPENRSGLGGIVDLETTGFSPERDEVIELCIILFQYDVKLGLLEIRDEYAGLREPGCYLHPRASQVHGLTRADLAGRELDYSRINRMIDQADFLLAHNASFDRGFLTRMFPHAGEKTWYCSMSGIDWKKKGFPSRGLQDLLYRHGIVVQRAHRARDDVMATLRLLSVRQPEGTIYLFELLQGKRAAG